MEANVRELRKLEYQQIRLAIASARNAKNRFVELQSGHCIYSMFVDVVNQVANEEGVRDVRFHSYWCSFAHGVASESGRVTLVLDIDKGK